MIGLRSLALVAAIAVVVMGGCNGTPVRSLPIKTSPVDEWCCTQGEEPISVEYLGVGGWRFRMGDASLLTAPFFSNPGLLEVAFARIRADTARIDHFLPPVQDAEAILVGHAHYDHLMDVPYILRTKAPRARMYGSRTAVNLVMGDPGLDPDRLVSVEDSAGDHERAGRWIHTTGGRMRFMALRSAHAPHFMGIHLYEGEVEHPAEELPTRAGDWVEGPPLAYLIDLLSPEGAVLFRIHYQDAAAAPPAGFPPPLDDGIPVDLAILCPPGYSEVEGYPEGILERLRPRRVLLGHWEDFFRPRSGETRAVPNTDLIRFIERMEAALPPGTVWAMLEPGTTLRVAAAGRQADPGRQGLW